VALLAAKTLDLGDSQAGDADFSQGFANFLELEGLDDGGDLFHRKISKGLLGRLDPNCVSVANLSTEATQGKTQATITAENVT